MTGIHMTSVTWSDRLSFESCNKTHHLFLKIHFTTSHRWSEMWEMRAWTEVISSDEQVIHVNQYVVDIKPLSWGSYIWLPQQSNETANFNFNKERGFESTLVVFFLFCNHKCISHNQQQMIYDCNIKRHICSKYF